MAGAGHQQAYFLNACFLCRKPLAENRDIYMYRGDIPFCSEECRSVQIAADEAAERAERARASARRPTRGPSTSRGVDGTQESGKIRAGSVLAL